MQTQQDRMLGDWLIQKDLGLGPLGRAFVAEHRFTKKQAELKILPEELSLDQGFISRFEEETMKVAALEHPGITKTYNATCVDGVYFLATEYVVDGQQKSQTLWEFLSGRIAAPQEVIRVAEQVAAVLDFAHSFNCGECQGGVAHGNLKPKNIMISESPSADPVIKVADFGLFRMVGCSSVLLRTYKAKLEQLSLSDPFFTAKIGHDPYQKGSVEKREHKELLDSLVQNMHFLSPEQKRGDWSNLKAADSWAFGVLLFWMLTGSYPEGSWDFGGRLSGNLIHWETIIRSCLSLDPSKRPSKLVPLFEERKSSSSASPVRTIYTQQAKEQMDDKQVTEFAPEKHDPNGIEPILTDMKRIEEGAYYRGSNQGCRDEMPKHKVRISSFLIDIHPVTNEQFVRFLEFLAGEKDHKNHDVIRIKDSRIKRNSGRYTIERGYAQHPVVGVTWYGAIAYSKWVGKRLPTEAEWEVACFGGLENPTYPTGEEIEKKQANFFSTDTTAVMSYPANGYDLFDMAGNVYEWCYDWYEYSYYEHSAQEPDFPKGPVQGVYRVLRGGCWKSLKEDLRCAKRHRNNPGAVNGTYGFRCAKDG